jgi:hypothetical protein
MDRNQDSEHGFHEQDYRTKLCIPLGFHFDRKIYGSITTKAEEYNLASMQIYYIVIPTSAA